MESYIPRYLKAPASNYFLFGPGGTGKSTYLKNQYPDSLRIDLAKPFIFRKFSAGTDRFLKLVDSNSDRKVIIVENIQKVPELLTSVFISLKENKEQKFIITGSNIRRLKRAGLNLKRRKFELKTLHPFLLSELNFDIPLDDVLLYGLLPAVINSEEKMDFLESYISFYVREEVHLEGYVRNICSFFRFLETVSYSHSSILNISESARECLVERKVVEGYIKILEDILLAFKIPVFTKKAKRALVTHPKFYFFDTGVYQTLRPNGQFDQPGKISGAALEGLVAQHLRAWIDYWNENYELLYWRSRGGLEVNFVLYGKEEIIAIQVKNSNKIRREDLRSLFEFREDYPQSKCFFLYRGDEKFLINNVYCFPCEKFLKALKPDYDIIHSFPVKKRWR